MKRPIALGTVIIFAVAVVSLGAASYAIQTSAEPETEYTEYRNDRWHYSLAVPADMKVSEH